MKSTSIVAVTLAVFLMLTVSFSSNLASIKTTEALLRPIESMLQFEWLKNIALKHYLALLWRCDDDVVDDKYCDVLIPTLRFAYEGTGFLGRLNIDKQLRSKAEDISYLNRRRLIPTHELPSLRIYMTDGAKIKLQNKRKTTLSERYAMLLTNDDDWVDATIFSENGALSNKTKVKLRLKGDLADHFGDPKKVSMRVEAKGNGLVFGTTKFSIQSPKTGYDQLEAIVSDTLRRVGVIAPDYFFVDVRLNDQVVGVMAFVEHFTKEMLESQGRREGPIVMIDEEWVWEQRFLNHNRMSDGLWQSISENLNWRGGQLWQSTNIRNIPPLALRDYPVQIFKLGVFDPRLVRINNSIRGASLLRDMVDGRISGRLVFDYDLMSLWWIMSHIWGAIHNLHFTNERFYFNPITNLLEPIVFNANAQPRQWCEPRNNPKTSCIVSDFSIRSIWTDPLFQRAVVRNKKRIAELLESTEFRDWLVAKQNEYLSLLDLDERGRSEPPIDTQLISGDILASNLLKFDEEVSRLFKQLNSKDPKNLQSSSAIQKESDLIKNEHQELLKVLEPLANHIRPFLYWSLDGFDLEIKNLTLSDVTIDSLFSARYSRKNYLQESIQIPSYQQESVSHILRLPITIPDPREATELRIRYSYRGQQFTKPVFLQFKNHNFGYKKLEDIKDWLIDIGVMIDETKRTITFPPGHYILTDRLQLTEDWRVRISAGATVEFRRGGALKVNGPVHAIGHKDNPVRIIIDSDPQLGPLGVWGGILVVNTNRESILRYTQVYGSGGAVLLYRQDSYGLTGCVTFYKTSVRIENSSFNALQCEDGLNIISSKFIIDSSKFVDSSADAFDSDFSDGIVTNSVFRNIMNDGIDVSGSQVQVSSSRFIDIRDKAISVGEVSRLDATELTIDGADAGVVSKDKSVVNIRNSSFKDVNSALMAYVKKEEWGPAEIHCDNCLFDNVASIAIVQHASRATIDGNEVAPTPFTRKQLKTAGYLQ